MSTSKDDESLNLTGTIVNVFPTLHPFAVGCKVGPHSDKRCFFQKYKYEPDMLIAQVRDDRRADRLARHTRFPAKPGIYAKLLKEDQKQFDKALDGAYKKMGIEGVSDLWKGLDQHKKRSDPRKRLLPPPVFNIGRGCSPLPIVKASANF